jgi:hypothetical protein
MVGTGMWRNQDDKPNAWAWWAAQEAAQQPSAQRARHEAVGVWVVCRNRVVLLGFRHIGVLAAEVMWTQVEPAVKDMCRPRNAFHGRRRPPAYKTWNKINWDLP